jgi:hypothetical protein
MRQEVVPKNKPHGKGRLLKNFRVTGLYQNLPAPPPAGSPQTEIHRRKLPQPAGEAKSENKREKAPDTSRTTKKPSKCKSTSSKCAFRS